VGLGRGRDRWDPGFDLPAFVRIGRPRIKTRDVNSGVLGPRYESFKIDEPGKLPEDVHPAVASEVLPRRLVLAAKLDEQFAARGSARAATEQREIYDRTSRFVLSRCWARSISTTSPKKLRDRLWSERIRTRLFARRDWLRRASASSKSSTAARSTIRLGYTQAGFQRESHSRGRDRQRLRDVAHRPG